MDNHGQKGVPMPIPIAHQNHNSIDSHQVEFLKSFYGNAHLDPIKVHLSLLQMLQELEKEDPCKNYYLDNRTYPNPNVRKDSSNSSCMKEDRVSMFNQWDGREIGFIREEGFANVSRHHYENFKTKEEVYVKLSLCTMLKNKNSCKLLSWKDDLANQLQCSGLILWPTRICPIEDKCDCSQGGLC